MVKRLEVFLELEWGIELQKTSSDRSFLPWYRGSEPYLLKRNQGRPQLHIGRFRSRPNASHGPGFIFQRRNQLLARSLPNSGRFGPNLDFCKRGRTRKARRARRRHSCSHGGGVSIRGGSDTVNKNPTCDGVMVPGLNRRGCGGSSKALSPNKHLFLEYDSPR